MALTNDFAPMDIYAQVGKTGIKGRHLLTIFPRKSLATFLRRL